MSIFGNYRLHLQAEEIIDQYQQKMGLPPKVILAEYYFSF
jgi:hypothetical protein